MARNELDKPKVLLLDIETFPLLGYAWTAYDANIIKIAKPTVICCWTAKWLDGKTITRALCDYPQYKPGSRDDRALCADLWALLDEADEVAAHNGKTFDVKKIQYRFMVHKFGPPSPFTVFDTLRENKKVAAPDKNNLAHLLPLYDLGEKLDSGGASLWFACEEGDPKAWARMKRYNRNDTAQLEPLYKMLRPWSKSHVNAGMWRDGLCCPKCGSERLQKRGTARNRTTAYCRYFCGSCGGWSRGRHNQRPLVAA